MRLTRHQPTLPSEVGVIPLINVIFLMLVFFMLFGTVTSPDLLDVEPPRSESQRGAPDTEVRVLVDADGRIAVNGEEVESQALSTVIDAVMRGQSGTRIVLKADAELRAATLLPVLEALQRSGPAEIALLTHGRASRE